MGITARRMRLAFRSPGHFAWAVRHVLRRGPLGLLEPVLLRDHALKPNLITVNITGRCNLRCEMCMQPRGALGEGDGSATVGAHRPELTTDEWCRVVDQVADARPAFYFTGGEPLLYEGLLDLIRHIKSRGLIAALVTNATLLARHAEALVDVGLDNLTLSIDGPEAIHDAVRGVPGSFRRATEGTAALRQAKQAKGSAFPTLKMNTVITPQTLATLEDTWEIARDLGVEEWNLQHPIFDTTENVARHNQMFGKILDEVEGTRQERSSNSKATERNRPSKDEGEFYKMSFTEEQFAQLEASLDRIVRHGKDGPRVVFFPTVRRKDWRGYYLNLHHPFQERCTAPWRMMRLLADGSAEPCLHCVVGNVRDQSPWEIWNGPPMARFRRALLRHRLFPACVRCCYRSY